MLKRLLRSKDIRMMMALNLMKKRDLKIRFNMGLIVRVMFPVSHHILIIWMMMKNCMVQKIQKMMDLKKTLKWVTTSFNLIKKKVEKNMMIKNLRTLKVWRDQLTRPIATEVKMFSPNRSIVLDNKKVKKKARFQLAVHLKWLIFHPQNNQNLIKVK